MVVVVRNSSPLLLVLVVLSIISIVIAAILIFALGATNGNLVVVAIPGFQPESIALGLALGILLIIVKRRNRTHVISTFS
ncbi:MAG TPA: hypothetical protein VLV18_01355 [Terriglobales bacterium]|nr:hypothetical protein [Terriglobales bacterium]